MSPCMWKINSLPLESGISRDFDIDVIVQVKNLYIKYSS